MRMDGNKRAQTTLLVTVAIVTAAITFCGPDGFSQSAATVIAIGKMDVGSTPAWIAHRDRHDRKPEFEHTREKLERAVMRVVVILLALFGYMDTLSAAQAAGSDNCSKECRDYQRACLKAHSQDACKTDYDICMKACRKK
jgi:hypothetical protein